MIKSRACLYRHTLSGHYLPRSPPPPCSLSLKVVNGTFVYRFLYCVSSSSSSVNLYFHQPNELSPDSTGRRSRIFYQSQWGFRQIASCYRSFSCPIPQRLSLSLVFKISLSLVCRRSGHRLDDLFRSIIG